VGECGEEGAHGEVDDCVVEGELGAPLQHDGGHQHSQQRQQQHNAVRDQLNQT